MSCHQDESTPLGREIISSPGQRWNRAEGVKRFEETWLRQSQETVQNGSPKREESSFHVENSTQHPGEEICIQGRDETAGTNVFEATRDQKMPADQGNSDRQPSCSLCLGMEFALR
jgi:hypothetical protein